MQPSLMPVVTVLLAWGYYDAVTRTLFAIRLVDHTGHPTAAAAPTMKLPPRQQPAGYYPTRYVRVTSFPKPRHPAGHTAVVPALGEHRLWLQLTTLASGVPLAWTAVLDGRPVAGMPLRSAADLAADASWLLTELNTRRPRQAGLPRRAHLQWMCECVYVVSVRVGRLTANHTLGDTRVAHDGKTIVRSTRQWVNHDADADDGWTWSGDGVGAAVADRWNLAPHLALGGNSDNRLQRCVDMADAAISAALPAPRAPHVYVWTGPGEAELTCLVTGFSAVDATVAIESVVAVPPVRARRRSAVLPNGDGTYQVRLTAVMPGRGRAHQYACVVHYPATGAYSMTGWPTALAWPGVWWCVRCCGGLAAAKLFFIAFKIVSVPYNLASGNHQHLA